MNVTPSLTLTEPPVRARYVVTKSQRLGEDADGRARSFEYTIECAAGEAPRVSLHAWSLTPSERHTLDQEIAETLAHFRIPCRCGLPYYEHAADSPHAAPVGDCRAFTASSPLAEEFAR